MEVQKCTRAPGFFSEPPVTPTKEPEAKSKDRFTSEEMQALNLAYKVQYGQEPDEDLCASSGTAKALHEMVVSHTYQIGGVCSFKKMKHGATDQAVTHVGDSRALKLNAEGEVVTGEDVQNNIDTQNVLALAYGLKRKFTTLAIVGANVEARSDFLGRESGQVRGNEIVSTGGVV